MNALLFERQRETGGGRGEENGRKSSSQRRRRRDRQQDANPVAFNIVRIDRSCIPPAGLGSQTVPAGWVMLN